MIGEALPEQVHLLTFEPWNKDSFLIRFEHILEKNEDPQLSQPVKFNLTRIFPGDYEFTEVTLAANQWLKNQVDPLKFTYKGAKSVDHDKPKQPQTQKFLEDLEITLRPMEIRTFVMVVMGPPPTSHGFKSQTIIILLPFISLITLFLKHLLQ